MKRSLLLLTVSLSAVAVLSTGCSSSRKASRLEGRYSMADPGSGWRSVKPGGADNAWLNDDLGASIYTDSNCGVRYEDSELRQLAERMTLGLEDEVEVSAEESTLNGRSAFTRRVRGGIDGVPVELAATVIKKDQCVYDFVVIAPPSSFEAAWRGYTAARDGFRTKP